MLTYETTDRKEAQRCRLAQFNGKFVTLMAEGSAVAGTVLSVRERNPGRWLITVIPKRKVLPPGERRQVRISAAPANCPG